MELRTVQCELQKEMAEVLEMPRGLRVLDEKLDKLEEKSEFLDVPITLRGLVEVDIESIGEVPMKHLKILDEKSELEWVKRVELWRREEELLREKGKIVRISDLRKLKEVPVLAPILGDWLSELKVSEKGLVNMWYVVKLVHKILDVKREIYSIGLKDGFVADINLTNKYVYGLLSVHADVLVGVEYVDELKERLKSEKNLLVRKSIEKGLSNKKELFHMFFKDKMKSPSLKLLYYELLLEVVTVYLYNVTLHLSEMLEGVEDIRMELKGLCEFFNTRMMPSIREKIKRVNPKMIKQIYIGYDTEYKNIAYGENKLVSAQLAVTGNLVLEITSRTSFKFDTIHTLTKESYRTEMLGYLESNSFAVEKFVNYLEKSIGSVRVLLHGNYDERIEKLVKKLELKRSIKSAKGKEGKMLFVTSKLPVSSKLLLAENVGLNWESLLAESIDECGMNDQLEKEMGLLEEYLNSSEEENVGNVEDVEHVEHVEKPLIKEVIKYGNIIRRDLREREKSSIKIKGGRYSKSVCVTVGSSEVYLISHFNVADLSMLEDWNIIKDRNVDIIGKSFVSIKRPIKTRGYNIYIRDTMLLASAASQTLAALGKMHGMTKPLLEEKSYLDMELFSKEDPKKFCEYALNDSYISLYHGLFVSNFALNLGSSKMPTTLGSLARLCLVKYWDDKKYKGYQIDPEYMLGDSLKVCTPVGVEKLGSVGGAYNMYVGAVKGGRNECLMFGRKKIELFDWDITSCYTTIMSMLGNPDYKKGRYIGEKELEEMSKKSEKLVNSYTVMEVSFKHDAGVKYPLIPVLAKGEKVNYVYSSEGSCYITGLEYLKLKELKSEVKVKSCFSIPFEKDGDGVLKNKPYSDFIKFVQGERRKYKKGVCEERMWKDIGNMCYGSSVTGLSNKLKYNPRTDQTERMVGSDVSNPIIGGWITGYVRCLIGESLNNINKLGGKVVSVTTDGFCTGNDVDPKKDDPKEVQKKYVNKRVLCDLSKLEESLLSLGKSDNTFLLRAREERLVLTDIKGKVPDPSVWELKCSVAGITQWSTRGQCSNYEEPSNVQKASRGVVAATTGLSRRGMDHKVLSDYINTVMEGGKEVSFVQRSLVGANLNYKAGLQCTPNLSIKSFKTKFDERREIVIPDKIRENYIEKGLKLPVDCLYDTRAWQKAEESSLRRGIMNKWKKSEYVMYSPKVLPSVKIYEDFNERSVIVDVLSGRAVDITDKDPGSVEYNVKKEMVMSLDKSVELLSKYRSYRRRLEIMSKKISVLISNIKSIEWEITDLMFHRRSPQDIYKIKKLKVGKTTFNIKTIYSREVKRIKKLVISLKVYSLWDRMGKAGGEASIELCRMLQLVRLRFLPS